MAHPMAGDEPTRFLSAGAAKGESILRDAD
jgi:hypothetical protein